MQRFHFLKKRYGVTKKWYEDKLNEQSYCCAICRKHLSEFKRNLCVDHCHHSGQLRGLLCHYCNIGIGNLSDSVDKLESALEYLRKWNADIMGETPPIPTGSGSLL